MDGRILRAWWRVAVVATAAAIVSTTVGVVAADGTTPRAHPRAHAKAHGRTLVHAHGARAHSRRARARSQPPARALSARYRRSYPPPKECAGAPSEQRVAARAGTDVICHRGEYHGGTVVTSVSYRVRLRFAAGGSAVPARIDTVVLRSSTGLERILHPDRKPGAQWVWLMGKRLVFFGIKPISWVVARVEVDGSDVVHASQQKFFPAKTRALLVKTLFFGAVVRVRDALLGSTAGSWIEVRFPNLTVRRYPLEHGEVVLPELPRGAYEVRSHGPGISFWTPVALSRDQIIELHEISYVDLVIVAIVLGSIAFALAAVRRPRVRRLAMGVVLLPVRRPRFRVPAGSSEP